MITTNMPPTPTLTSNLANLSTPGTIFLNKKPSFRTKTNEYCHYKLENLTPTDDYRSLPNRKRTTMNVTFNAHKNEIDPYVHALNWLPKFKAHCKGYLARKIAKKLEKEHEAVRIIQNSAEQFLDPWMQIFNKIRPTLKIFKSDELKKYLRQCIIQMKKLNAERMFIENQLDDVENTLDQSLNINTNNNCLSLEGRKSPNIFGKMSEIKANANNDTFLKECLDLNIDGLENLDLNFDPTSCQNSKIHAVFEKSDKLQLKIHENQHKIQDLTNKCNNLEKEIKDLRNNNTTLDSTGRIMKGIIHKNDREKDELNNKMADYEDRVKGLIEERKKLLNKLKETESDLSKKAETLEELKTKCEYLDNEIDRKTKSVIALSQEKTISDKKIKELEETISYNNEIQQENESNYELQKSRMKEMKKRYLEQLKTSEEDHLSEKNSLKSHLQDLIEQNESLQEKIKQYESTIWRLEREITDSKDREGSDEDIDHERERKLSMLLKNAKADGDTLKEEMKLIETNYEETKKKNQELESNLDSITIQATEYRKQIERLKAQILTLKSTFSETELNLNRANREKNFVNQKYLQAKEQNVQLEEEISKLKEDITANSQNVSVKSKEVENLESDIYSLKREYESKISVMQELNYDLQSQVTAINEKLNQNQEEAKRNNVALKQEIDEQKQLLEEKEIEQENTLMENLKHQQMIKKLQKRIAEQDEIQNDFEKTIIKLKEENKSLKEERDNEIITSPTEYRTLDYLKTENRLLRSSSSINSSINSNNNTGVSTLPRMGSNRY